tara:strand:- start:214 stop:639 length:426 start_codon:yes stop_codon:yes gene_type:complete
MGDEFYSVIKLVSGEEIFALVSIDENDGEGDPMILLQSPIVMNMIQSSKGSYIKVSRWIELSHEDFFMIRSDKILTMTESNDRKLINIYNNYINDEDPELIDMYTNGRVKISNEMGYISNVEDARKKFEKLFNINQEPKES